jgi:hypothetical protein
MIYYPIDHLANPMIRGHEKREDRLYDDQENEKLDEPVDQTRD